MAFISTSEFDPEIFPEELIFKIQAAMLFPDNELTRANHSAIPDRANAKALIERENLQPHELSRLQELLISQDQRMSAETLSLEYEKANCDGYFIATLVWFFLAARKQEKLHRMSSVATVGVWARWLEGHRCMIAQAKPRYPVAGTKCKFKPLGFQTKSAPSKGITGYQGALWRRCLGGRISQDSLLKLRKIFMPVAHLWAAGLTREGFRNGKLEGPYRLGKFEADSERYRSILILEGFYQTALPGFNVEDIVRLGDSPTSTPAMTTVTQTEPNHPEMLNEPENPLAADVTANCLRELKRHRGPKPRKEPVSKQGPAIFAAAFSKNSKSSRENI